MEIRVDTAANCIADLARGHREGLSPLHLSSRAGFPGEVRCADKRTVYISNQHSELGGILLDCWEIAVWEEGCYSKPAETYELDARGLVEVKS